MDRLVQSAMRAREEAYAPHSHFYVGAALLAPDGSIHLGCNVENASYGLTICAERNAVTSAIVSGCRTFRAIAVASVGGVTPCGACRQFLAEFGLDLTVVCVDALTNGRRQFVLGKLLPEAFESESLPASRH